MMKIVSNPYSPIPHLRSGWALLTWLFLILLASVVSFTITATGGVFWGLFAWMGLVIFGRVLWVKTELGGLLFGAEQTEPTLNDVSASSNRLERMREPYPLDASLMRRPVFIGMAQDERGKRYTVRLPPELIRKNHISFIGASGTGKTKLTTLMLAQMLDSGDSVVCFDPKDDQFLPGILVQHAKQLGRPAAYINLRHDAPQINPFKGATRPQREQILQAALQLDPSGNPAVDFHRGEDRDACASLVATGLSNMVDLATTGANLKAVTSRTNFWREFRELARLEAFHTEEGPNLEEVIQAGGLIYIVGDTDDLRIFAGQRMLLARVLQIIKGRERDGARQVSLFLDEFKYMLSNVALRALGTIRDRQCNLMLAYQSYGDLEDCGTLPPKAVLGAAKGNTTLKFVFKLEDGATAREFSSLAGERAVVLQSMGKSLDAEGREQVSWREANKAAVTVDMLTTAMPKPIAGQASVCWVFGIGPAFTISTMHLPAGPQPKITKATPIAAGHMSAMPIAQELI